MQRLLALAAFLFGAIAVTPAPDLEQAKSDAAGALAYASLIRESPLPTPTPDPAPVRTEPIASEPMTAEPIAAAPAEETNNANSWGAAAAPAVPSAAVAPPAPIVPQLGRPTFAQQPVYRYQVPQQPWYWCPSGNYGPTWRYRSR
jgi:hypothetical protein